jgi:NADPH:quinone reductase-like Zn-dependent oxidoreductase
MPVDVANRGGEMGEDFQLASLSNIEAAALPVVGVTAWQMLFDHAQAREGQTVVVHGSAGNVGAYAVQLARSCKLQVIGTILGGDPGYVRGWVQIR